MKVDLKNVKYELVEIVGKKECFLDAMDIEVDDTHYYTLKSGIVSHNSVSILTQTTSGIEPLFQMSYTRRKKININDKNIKIDFTDDNGDRWQEFEIIHPKIKVWKEITKEEDIEKSPWKGSCAEEINWEERVKLQATANKHIDHSISSCITSDSLIETNNGLLYFDELTDLESIEVNSFEKNDKDIKILNYKMDSVSLDEYYNNGVKPVLNLKLLNGLEIKCTANEKFLVLNDDTGMKKWKKISEIKEGDRVEIKTIDHSK